jgi:uncharacterized protein (TIGR03437 family)
MRHAPAAICLFALALSTAPAARPPFRRDSPTVLGHLTVASLGGSGVTTIQSLAQDAAGNLYVSGTTTAPDFPVRNASQSAFAEARVLRTTNLGATWTGLKAPPEVASLLPDPVDPQVLFGWGDTGIYKTADAGRTWKLVRAATVNSMAVDPGNHRRVAAVTRDDVAPLLRSLDGGETWTAGPTASSGAMEFVTDPGGSGALLLLGFPAVISRDWGATFQTFQPPGPGSLLSAAFDPHHPGWIYAGTAAGVMGSFYLSTDFGLSWTAKASPSTIFSAIQTLIVDPDVPDALMAGTVDGLFRSADGGASWTRQSAPGSPVSWRDAFAIVPRRCSPSGGLFAKASGLGFYSAAFSLDAGASWSAPQFSYVSGVTSGAGCAFYVVRQTSTDAFAAKLAPDGSILWSTYLGGGDRDSVTRLVLDAAGSVYIAGDTWSPDFPSTLPRIGVTGSNAAFLTKLTPGGRIDYSVLVSGETYNSATALAVEAAGNVWIGGSTLSDRFPVTPGALLSRKDEGSYTGFLVKLATNGALLSSTYLGPSYAFVVDILADASGEPVIVGRGAIAGFPSPDPSLGFVAKLNAAGSRILRARSLETRNSGSASLGADEAGNLLIAMTGDPSAYHDGMFSPSPCLSNFPFPSPADLVVSKLLAADWTTVSQAVLRSHCGIQVRSLQLDGAGSPVVGLAAGPGLSLSRPLLGASLCSELSGAVARLSADGSRLDFATYLDGCGPAAVAPQKDGSILATTSPETWRSGPARLLRIPPPAPGPSIDAISNAFSGDRSGVVTGGLLNLAVSGPALPSVDLGLERTLLPTALGGVEVRFDGIPAGIVRTAPGEVTVVAPSVPLDRSTTAVPGQTSVRLFFNDAASNVVRMPVIRSRPGLLTTDFLDPVWRLNGGDGYVVNADGTVNRAGNPALPGSEIKLFLTGNGPANPALYSSWKIPGFGVVPAPEVVSPLPGFLPAVQQMVMTVPASPAGIDVGNGVRRVFVGVRFGIVSSSSAPYASNAVALYVRTSGT